MNERNFHEFEKLRLRSLNKRCHSMQAKERNAHIDVDRLHVTGLLLQEKK